MKLKKKIAKVWLWFTGSVILVLIFWHVFYGIETLMTYDNPLYRIKIFFQIPLSRHWNGLFENWLDGLNTYQKRTLILIGFIYAIRFTFWSIEQVFRK